MSSTHGGRYKVFSWRLKASSICITNKAGREHIFSLSETQKIIQWLEGKFGRDWFPLANNVTLMNNGEERDGLGIAILTLAPNNITHAQGSSYLGVVLEEVGIFEWNREKKGIQWRIVSMPESLDQLRQVIGTHVD